MPTAADRNQYPSLADRQRFARTLSIWISRNGWTHETMHDWGEQAHFPALRNSSTNRLQNALTEQPSPLTFIQLAIANQRVAESNYSGVDDRRLMDRLKDSEPIRRSDGTPWQAHDFFGHFVGEIEAPQWAVPPKLLTAEEASALSREHQERFAAIAKAKMLPPPQAWRQLDKQLKGWGDVKRSMLRDVLSGWHTWTPSDWEALSDDGSDPVADALAAWEAEVDD